MLLRLILAIAEAAPRRRLRQLLREHDVQVEIVKGTKKLWRRALSRGGDIILIDEASFLAASETDVPLSSGLPTPPAIVVVTDSESPTEYADLLAAGVDTVLYSGLADDLLGEALETIFEKRRDLAVVSLTQKPLATPRLSDFVSDSRVMQEFMRTVERVVRTNTSLLILGETGVGKERLARAIHAEGPRSAGPFIAVNCGALPESLLESELFGHEEGAFTGATRARRGSFELAHGGTIFLDEIGDMPLHLQVKLLRVLQDHEIQRVGGEGEFLIDVRVMAASNRNLEAEVENRRFRQDLYYRLSVVTLSVPPLRERCEDISALVDSYIEYHRPRIGCEVYSIAPEAINALHRYNWPGNVRELINIIERAMLLCDGDKIALADLPAGVSGSVSRNRGTTGIPCTPDEVPEEWLQRPLIELRDSFLTDIERVYIAAMLKATGGKVGEAAERSGIEARSLYEKMKKYGLAKEDFKPRVTRRRSSGKG